jgi:type I restriction enzyme S subunit
MIKKQNIPKLRFPEFQNAPEWEEKPLGKIGEIVTGNTPNTSVSEYYVGSRLFVSPADISSSRYILTTKTTLTELGFSETRQIKENSILFVCIGSTIGKVAQNKYTCATNQQINSVIPFAEYSNDFMYSSLENNSSQIALLAGNHAVPIINKTLFSSVKILVPKLAEQQKIADCLSSLDELITAQAQKVEALKTHKKALMQRLFPREGESIPRLRFPEFQNAPEWEEKPLEKLLTIGSGKDYKHLSSGNVPVYGSGGYMHSVDDYLYDGDSVCIGRKGTINKPMFLTGKFWTVDTLFYTHSFKDCLPKFIYSCFQKINWLDYNEAGGIPSLSKTTIGKIEIRVPKVEEQQKIADCLSSLDELITAQAQKVEALKTHKKALMRRLFPDTGGK